MTHTLVLAALVFGSDPAAPAQKAAPDGPSQEVVEARKLVEKLTEQAAAQRSALEETEAKLREARLKLLVLGDPAGDPELHKLNIELEETLEAFKRTSRVAKKGSADPAVRRHTARYKELLRMKQQMIRDRLRKADEDERGSR